ncbi:MAG: zinc ribbon domain-containing protein [Firmicutes bacterium]|nr:zinc ribbon domain-containing protein [Bacillota bacterium]
MPIYEYQCQACQHKFEQLRKATEPTPDCPKCQSSEVKKLMSAFGFKGVGADGVTTTMSGGGCSGCSGGSCSTCH